MSDPEGDFRCPHCLGALGTDKGGLHCSTCGVTYPVRGAIADFSQPREAAVHAPPDAVNSGNAQAMFVEPCDTSDLGSDSPVPWKFLLPLSPGAWVLDLGCGRGGISTAIAAHVERVFALGPSLTSLHVATQRFVEDEADRKITAVAADIGHHLPFPEAQFDVIVLAGGLEKLAAIGSAQTGHEARSADRSAASAPLSREAMDHAFGEIKRVLKPTGTLFLTARNRLYCGMQKCRASFTDPVGWMLLLPPAVADLAGRILGPAGRGPALYGPGGYQRLLRRHGLRVAATFGLYPDLEECAEIVPFLVRRQIWRTGPTDGMGQRARRAKQFAPAIGLLAGPSHDSRPILLETVTAAIERQLSLARGSTRLNGFQTTGKDKCIVFATLGSRPAVIKLPMGAAAFAGESRNHDILQHAHSVIGEPAMVPRALARGLAQNAPYFAEDRVPGRPLRAALREIGRTAYLGQVARLLRSLNPSPLDHPEQPLLGALYEDKVARPLEKVLGVLDDRALVSAGQALFRERLHGVPVRLGLVHGTFTPSNIMVDGDEIRGLLDWEDGEVAGIPTVDAMYYVESCERMFCRRPLSDTIARLAHGQWGTAAEIEFLELFYTYMGISREHHVGLAYIYWIHHVHSQVDYQLSHDRAAAQARVGDVLRRLLEHA